MRSITSLLLFAIIFAGISGCKKSPLTVNKDSQELIRGAQAWFQSQSAVPAQEPFNQRTSTARSPVWAQAQVLDQGDGPAVIVPVHYSRPFLLMTRQGGPRLYQGDDITHLVLYKDPTHAFHAELVTALPDTSYNPRAGVPFTGLLLVDRWDGTPIARYRREGTSISVNIPGEVPTTQVTGFITQTCYEIVGYNYSPSDPNNGESWSEDAGCTPNYSALGTPSSQFGLTAKSYLDIGGGGGSRPPSPAASFVVVGGNNPIANIAAYLKCFQNVTGSNYSVTLAVEQPLPGSRSPIYFPPRQLDPTYTIGHTFLIFQQISATGVITIRSIGFYPKASVSPFSPEGLGSLNNDEKHWANVGMTFSVNGAQFMSMLCRASTGNNENYNLNSFNCTTWALTCLSAGGINISTQPGDWMLGSGDDPGDLGEDLRTLLLSNSMTRNEIPGNAPSNLGTCP